MVKWRIQVHLPLSTGGASTEVRSLRTDMPMFSHKVGDIAHSAHFRREVPLHSEFAHIFVQMIRQGVLGMIAYCCMVKSLVGVQATMRTRDEQTTSIPLGSVFLTARNQNIDLSLQDVRNRIVNRCLIHYYISMLIYIGYRSQHRPDGPVECARPWYNTDPMW